LQQQLTAWGDEKHQLLQQQRDAMQELAALELVVTDHAVCRYLERHMGVDLDQVRDRLASTQTIRLEKILGEGRYPIEGGGTAVVRNKHVVTVI
jgi:hypothetical protein